MNKSHQKTKYTKIKQEHAGMRCDVNYEENKIQSGVCLRLRLGSLKKVCLCISILLSD